MPGNLVPFINCGQCVIVVVSVGLEIERPEFKSPLSHEDTPGRAWSSCHLLVA